MFRLEIFFWSKFVQDLIYKEVSHKYGTVRSLANLILTEKQMNRLADIDLETRKAVSAFIERIARQYEMDGAILFGSRARKSHHGESDADVAVLLHGHGGEFVSTKLAMADVA
jgi:predicted nucleotidyltransferase